MTTYHLTPTTRRFIRLMEKGERRVIGPIKPKRGMRQGIATYCGPSTHLRGKRALIVIADGRRVLGAQFNDPSTGKAYGWWPFSINSFKDIHYYG